MGANGGMRIVWLISGLASVALGGLGAVLPLLPTTPFMLLAAFCFSQWAGGPFGAARSGSDRLIQTVAKRGSDRP